eukprot:87624-Heterocapsa_arctica.AAC.1
MPPRTDTPALLPSRCCSPPFRLTSSGRLAPRLPSLPARALMCSDLKGALGSHKCPGALGSRGSHTRARA